MTVRTSYLLQKQILKKLAVVSIATVLVSLQAVAAALPAKLTERALLDIMLTRSPKLAALRSQVRAAEANLTAAGVLPNPRVNYGRYDLLGGFVAAQFNGNQQQTSSVDIPLMIAGQRGMRQYAAEKGLKAAEARTAADVAQLARQVRILYQKLLAAQERVAVFEDASRHLNRVKAIVTGRASVGAASAYEVLRLSVEEASLSARLADMRTEVTSRGGEIGAALGISGWFPQAQGRLQALGVQVDADSLKVEAQARNPAIEQARREESAATAAVASAKRERWPIPIISFGSVWTNSPYSLTSFLGVSVEVPLFDQKQGLIARARADKRIAMLSLSSLTEEMQAEVERAARVLLEKQHVLKNFEHNVSDQLSSLDRMSEDAYRLGQGGFVQLLDAIRARTEVRLNEVDLQESLTQAEIDVLAATGRLMDDAESFQLPNRTHAMASFKKRR